MGGLLVVLIILGCVAYQYLKGTFVKSFAIIIISICAGVVAFGYFELLANILVSREILALWAQPLSFAMLFILTFAILQTIAAQLTRRSVDLGFLPERIGRVVCGIFLGLIISGFLLTAAAMAPISAKYPYQRFNQTTPDPENPSKALLNADGLATGWFSIISSGSFSGKRSFAVLHPAFLDQLFLNRHEIDNRVSIITSPGAIEIPKKAVWPAPEGLKDSNGKPVLSKGGYNLTIVRLEITTKADEFTLSQLRVVCKQKDDKNPLVGKGKNIYPAGYLKTAGELQIKKLTDLIKIDRSYFKGSTIAIDFAFYVPDGFVPVLAEFKQNSINQLPPPVTADQAPSAVSFPPSSEPAADTAKNTSEDASKDTAQKTAEPNSPK
ncbi:MAG: CvpA family protein [Sedimentisphaerales bacterium]